MILNLIPRAQSSQFLRQELIRIAINLSVALFPVLLIFNASASYGTKSLETSLKIALTPSPSGISSSVRETNAILSRINNIQNQTIQWSKWLYEINSVTPREIGFKTITLNRPSSSLLIQGTAQTRDGLLNYQSKLASLKFINNPQLPFGELLSKENIQFSISAGLTLPIK